MWQFFKDLQKGRHSPGFGALEILKYIGPGLLVTVGFIDPGNWASNILAGSSYGYTLLWVVTLSTIMLIVLQHNAAHLGIASGLCLSEAANKYLPAYISRPVLITAMVASVSTSLAEVMGAAIALNMLFHLPIKIGSILVVGLIIFLLLSNTYHRIEKWIIGFVSIIGISFIYELFLSNFDLHTVLVSFVNPVVPAGSITLIMSVLGAVVMPHNLFLHSEIIQSRQWNLEDEKVIKHQLKYEFADTIISMLIGWAINSAMIILAASAFHSHHIVVNDLQQAQVILSPLLGKFSSIIFAVALLFAGISSTITSGMSGGAIFAGFFSEPYDMDDNHSRLGMMISFISALIIIFFIGDPFKGLVISQMILSIQLPFTIFLLLYLTSSRKVMGKFANSRKNNLLLFSIALIVTYLNIKLFISFF
jgi:manganese transport protein